MDTRSPLLPVFAIKRHQLKTDGRGVTTLVGAYGCPLRCHYCLNPHAWDPKTLEKCRELTPSALYEQVKIDDLYFLATKGGITFGGGESLLHADFIKQFRQICKARWTLTLETSLNVPKAQLEKILDIADDFIVDIKDLDPSIYQAYTGTPIDKTLYNLKLLSENISQEHILIRVPQIPGFNEKEHVQTSVKKLKNMGFENIEVFPYIIRNKHR